MGRGLPATRAYATLLAITLLVQFALVAWTFPIGEVLGAKPLFWIDSAYHWYQMTIAAQCVHGSGIVCYDPFFAAGYPAGVTYNWSAKLPALVARLGGESSVTTIYKLFAFTSAIAAPVCIPAAARVLRLETRIGVVATIGGFLLWWASVLHWYHTAGMVSFVFASYLALTYVAFVYRYLLDAGGWRTVVALGLSGALAMFYHPLFAIPVGMATLGLIAVRPQTAKSKRLLGLTAVAGLALLPNLAWIVPMLTFQHAFGIDVRNESPYQQVVDLGVLWQELLGRWQGHAQGSKLYAPLALAAAWACVGPSVDARDRLVARAFTTGAISLALFASSGATISFIATMQPNRYLPVAYLLLVVPAAMGVVATSVTLQRRRGAVRVAAMFMAVVSVAAGAYGVREVTREISYGDHPHYGEKPPEVKGVGAITDDLVRWISANTDESGRVLLETSPGRVLDNTHSMGYLAAMTGREFIGGPYPYAQFASFWEHTAFRRPIETFTPERFAEYLKTYNVGWIVAYSDRSEAYLDRMPFLTGVARRSPLRAYRVDLPRSYFLVGRGRVVARRFGSIVLDDLEGDEIVLKYHYVQGMRAIPSVILDKFNVLDDPNPFVRLVHPPRTLTLYLP